MYAELLGLAVFLSVSLKAQKLDFLMAVKPNPLQTCDVVSLEVQALRATTTKIENRVKTVSYLMNKWADALDATNKAIAPLALRRSLSEITFLSTFFVTNN